MKFYWAFWLIVFPLISQATSTGSGTARNLVIDGVVNTGANPGSNSVVWETDEVLAGFNNIVNWYLTWDDDNLYLGRVGGNNNEISVIYLHASYPGATDINQAYNFSGLNPDLSAMGGINFAARFQQGSDEFVNYSNSAWTTPNNSLTPLFSTQPNGDHLEVVIPWNAITNNNGRPTNFRCVMYQAVDPSVAGCPGGGPFVYGESPWGTGNAGDGPSIAVNDGQPTSSRQPGGCDTGADSATRWWGCYPISGDIGPNTWTPIAPVAGPDTTICASSTAFVLQGNTPPSGINANWITIANPGGTNPTFPDPGDPNTVVQGLTAIGSYIFVWNMDYMGCPVAPDSVTIDRLPPPTPADAGPDRDLPCDAATVQLAGSFPGADSATWTVIRGNGTLLDPDSATTNVTGLSYGENIFVYAIDNGICPPSTDTVIIRRFQPVTALAGNDDTLCNASIAQLSAIDPIFFGGDPQSNWTQISGPSSVLITDPQLYNTTISGLFYGRYGFAWTITNGSCPVSADTIYIENIEPPFADAGADQTLCTQPNIQLNGNDPRDISSFASGIWTQIAGAPASFTDISDYNTLVGNLTTGNYSFRWEVDNDACPSASDVVNIELVELQSNGATILVSPTANTSNGSIAINPPTGGAGPFSYSLDGRNYQADSSFSGLAAGVYDIFIRDQTGCEATTMLVLTATDNPAGPTPIGSIVAPTGFSPNGDNVNDTWLLENVADFPEVRVEIYNVWGSKVFESIGYHTPWDGNYNGEPLPMATYYFMIDPNQAGFPVQKGALTIFR